MVELFPPKLVSVLRDRFRSRDGCLTDVADEVLIHLLTTVFFAGLETYEGERNPIRVVFLGKRPVDVVMPVGAESGPDLIYRWKVLRFQTPRPFAVSEIVKLAVASAAERIYSAVHVIGDGQLVVTGLASEGIHADADPFLKVITSRPGSLSIRSGRERLLEYDRGNILTGGEDVVSARPVRRALGELALAAGLENDDVADYFDAVRALVREMAAHGRGGILIITPEEQPFVGESTYEMMLDSSLGSLVRLARRIEYSQPSSRPHRRHFRRLEGGQTAPVEGVAYRYVLRNAFLSEADRVVEELGALTGIDGATVLNNSLALIAFGVVLPVGQRTALAEASDDDGLSFRAMDFGSRGTRHRAAATYAAEHPGSVVFVSSAGGPLVCMMRDPSEKRVLLWELARVD